MRWPRLPGRPAVGGLAVVLLFLGGAACNGNDEVPVANGEIEVEASEFEFDPDTINVADGQFTIVLVNVGNVEHDFLIEGVDDPDDPDVIYADPGETDRGDYDLEDGTYTFYCDIPGHRDAGMEGTLTVG